MGRTHGSRAPRALGVAALIASAALWIAGGDGARAGALALLVVAVALLAARRSFPSRGAAGAGEGDAASGGAWAESSRERSAADLGAEADAGSGSGAEVDDGEPAEVPIEDAMDLHGFAPRDVLSVVEAYLEAAHERGLREVRLIHGRGKGVQRARVQALLARHPLVERYATAPASRGGWGATIAWLVRKSDGSSTSG